MAKILLAPSLEEALKAKETYGDKIVATVEAEYGSITMQGSKITLAHHGANASNPAPCNTDILETLKDDDIILISHIDLDTVGGILALEGRKPADPEFWQAAEFIDLNGPHHAFKFGNRVVNSLNAIWAANTDRTRFAELTDVTDKIVAYATTIETGLNPDSPGHEASIQAGREWAHRIDQEVSSRCLFSSDKVRIFITDGVFTASSYCFKDANENTHVAEATLTYNTKFNSITLAFEDGGKTQNAEKIMKEIFGPEAGGRAGIAGSPRGVQMTFDDLIKVAERIYPTIDLKHSFDLSKVGYREGSFLYRDSAKDEILRFFPSEKNHKIHIPEGVTSICETTIGDFEGCKIVHVPDSLERVPDNIFNGVYIIECKKETSIVDPIDMYEVENTDPERANNIQGGALTVNGRFEGNFILSDVTVYDIGHSEPSLLGWTPEAINEDGVLFIPKTVCYKGGSFLTPLDFGSIRKSPVPKVIIFEDEDYYYDEILADVFPEAEWIYIDSVQDKPSLAKYIKERRK